MQRKYGNKVKAAVMGGLIAVLTVATAACGHTDNNSAPANSSAVSVSQSTADDSDSADDSNAIRPRLFLPSLEEATNCTSSRVNTPHAADESFYNTTQLDAAMQMLFKWDTAKLAKVKTSAYEAVANPAATSESGLSYVSSQVTGEINGRAINSAVVYLKGTLPSGIPSCKEQMIFNIIESTAMFAMAEQLGNPDMTQGVTIYLNNQRWVPDGA